MKNRLVVDVHTHTVSSGHAYGTMEERGFRQAVMNAVIATFEKKF